ncbi:MAG: hypothetical protein ACPGOV_09445 [Magnetovibrionaceae bacterium]
MIEQRHGDHAEFNSSHHDGCDSDSDDLREGLPPMVWVTGLLALVAVLLWMFGSYRL